MYIEDEIPRLINGDAIVKDGNKYATNFIVLRLCDKKVMETKFAPIVADVTDYFLNLFSEQESNVSKIGFYGSDFTMKRLGYIALPAVLRGKIKLIKKSLNMENGAYPPRLDGGYGWFVVDEKETDNESLGTTESGCNSSGDETDFIYYYWIGKYFNNNVYHNGGTNWLAPKKIVRKAQNGVIPDGALFEDDLIRLIKANLVIKDGGKYKFNFAIFDKGQFDTFMEHFNKTNAKLDERLDELITDIHNSFKMFVPKRLDSQINQWVSCYVNSIIGFIADELINRGILEKPDDKKPLTNGVFCILDKYLNV